MPDNNESNQAAAAATLANPTTQTVQAHAGGEVQFPSGSPGVQETLFPQALKYLDIVKTACQDEPGKYATFLSVLKGFHAGE